MLHACAHNPTGVDPRPEQWKEIADLVKVNTAEYKVLGSPLTPHLIQQPKYITRSLIHFFIPEKEPPGVL